MKRADFDWASESRTNFDKDRYDRARSSLRRFRRIFRKHSDVITGYWIGSRNGEPYVMVAIERGKVEKPEELLPDRLDNYKVYYIEGTLHI
ncbi:MAG: hypothetical protein ACE5IJ_08255 [Thermoplasmata archaeon]